MSSYPLTGDAERSSVAVRFEPFSMRYEVVGTFDGSANAERIGAFRTQAEAMAFAREWRDSERPDGLICVEPEDGESWEIIP